MKGNMCGLSEMIKNSALENNSVQMDRCVCGGEGVYVEPAEPGE